MLSRSLGNLAGIVLLAVLLFWSASSIIGWSSEPPIYTIKQEYRPTLDKTEYWLYRDGRIIGLAPTLEEARRRLLKAREAGPEKVVETIR